MTDAVDLTAPDVDADPFPLFDRLRARGPVVWSERHRAWLAVSHESVLDGLRAPWLSSDRIGTFERVAASRPDAFRVVVDLLRGWMVFRDPPAHTRLRDPVRRAFTPRRVDDLRGDTEAIADELLDGLEPHVDLRPSYARPLPALVIARLLDVPAADRGELQAWSDQLTGVVFSAERSDADVDGPAEAAERFTAYFGDLAEHRRRHPGDDLVSALVHASGPGAPEPSELVGACTLLLFAGHETTATLIANGTSMLLDHPDQLARLLDDPGLWPTAVDELMRRAGPAKTMVRKAAVGRPWFGVDVAAGDTVFLVLLAASHDPAVFADPERLDIARHPNQHAGFGWGIHHCLGASLARLEAEVALRRLFERFPETSRAAPARWGGGVLGRAVAGVSVVLGPERPTAGPEAGQR